jgi:4-diphosphocytidyl-2-C-methyl-D-erythritol kinase
LESLNCYENGGTRKLTLKAPAKINLGLRILGERSDGYHEIWTILQQIDLWDEILLEESSDLSFSLDTTQAGIPEDESNLCVKAARLLQEETGCDCGARIELKKNIPAGAGLGGGSSDAAAVLMGLNDLWEPKQSEQDLSRLAVRLGSDVPFFIKGGCCLATGRGEILTPIERFIDDPIILVCPDLQVSTAWAYKNIENYRLTSHRENIIFQNSLPENLYNLLIGGTLDNEFEALVLTRYPKLKELKDTLLKLGTYYASLSGSGSAVFGIFRHAVDAEKAAEQLRSFGETYRVRAL